MRTIFEILGCQRGWAYCRPPLEEGLLRRQSTDVLYIHTCLSISKYQGTTVRVLAQVLATLKEQHKPGPLSETTHFTLPAPVFPCGPPHLFWPQASLLRTEHCRRKPDLSNYLSLPTGFRSGQSSIMPSLGQCLSLGASVSSEAKSTAIGTFTRPCPRSQRSGRMCTVEARAWWSDPREPSDG